MDEMKLSEILDVAKKAAILLKLNPEMQRMDGNGWSVYIVGNIVRIDIKLMEK